MKKGIIRSIVGCAVTLTLVAGLSACGSETIPQGTVDKGFVTGATVKDGNGNVLMDKTVGGKFPVYGPGPYTTSGGTYTDMSGKTRNCPPLAADGEYKNITPMTTLYRNASDADKKALEALCTAAGVTPDTIVTVANIPANLVAIKKLNETVGEALTQIKDSGKSDAAIADFAKKLSVEIAKIKKLDVATTTTDALVTAIKTAATATAVPFDESKLTQIGDLTVENATVPDAPKTDATPIKITGTTGGSSSGTGGK